MREVPWKKSTLRMRRPALGVAAAVRVIVAGAAIKELEGAVSDTDTAQAEFVNTTAHKARPKPRRRRSLAACPSRIAVTIPSVRFPPSFVIVVVLIAGLTGLPLGEYRSGRGTRAALFHPDRSRRSAARACRRDRTGPRSSWSCGFADRARSPGKWSCPERPSIAPCA